MVDMFGPYRVEEMLGRGGMGEVHRAVDTRHDRAVALKRLSARLGADEQFEQRFRRECAMVAALEHPNIVAVHDYGEIDGRLYLDMQLVDGPDLDTLLRRHGPLGLTDTMVLLSQVAAALDAAHERGLVHRDIKPANILVSADGGTAYVADFGVARAAGSGSTSLTSTGAAVGSLAYMAPERFVGSHGDHRADVYALGCLLFEMLTAHPPFTGDGLPAMIHAHLNLAPPPLAELVDGIPPELDRVIAQAMAKDPTDRYASAGALAADARAAVAGEPVVAAVVSRPPAVDGAVGPMARNRRPRPATLVALSTAAVLALLGLVSLGVETATGPGGQLPPLASPPASSTVQAAPSYSDSPFSTTPQTSYPTSSTSEPPAVPYVDAPATGGTSDTPTAGPRSPVSRTSSPPSAASTGPTITGSSTYQEGQLVYLRVRYRDDGTAVGFGFRGVGRSTWAQETHPFSDPSYGQVSPGEVVYPFNHACGTAQASESDLVFWIYDAAGRRDSITVHLTCAE